MRAFTVRMVLSGLALSPALFLQLVSPVQMGQFAKLAGGAPGIVMASAVIALVPVLVAQLLPGKRKDPIIKDLHQVHCLLQEKERARQLRTAPADRHLEQDLTQALNPARPNVPMDDPEGPTTKERVIANLLRSTMQQMRIPLVSHANRAQKVELHMLMQLLQATPQQAGDMARGFCNPEAVSKLHDLVQTAATIRQVFERQSALFESAQALWIMRRPGKAQNLQSALQSYALTDPDLWHHVVTSCQMDDPAQNNAAHWCLAQPACDQGTAAAYLRRVVLSGHLEVLAARTKTHFGAAHDVSRIVSVLRRWRCGYYKSNKIASGEISDDDIARFDMRFRAATEKLGVDLPYPKGLFAPGGGLSAQARSNWCFRTGQMIAPPREADYFGDNAV